MIPDQAAEAMHIEESSGESWEMQESLLTAILEGEGEREYVKEGGRDRSGKEGEREKTSIQSRQEEGKVITGEKPNLWSALRTVISLALWEGVLCRAPSTSCVSVK